MMWPSMSSQRLRSLHTERLSRLKRRDRREATPPGATPLPPGVGNRDAEVIELAFGAQCDTRETIGA